MPKTYIDIILSYYCTQNCPYCYLGTLRNEVKMVPANVVDRRLEELMAQNYVAEEIEIHGGNFPELPKQHVREVIDVCLKYTPKVNIIGTSYAYDFSKEIISNTISVNRERKDYFQNITTMCERPNINMITVALPDVFEESPDYFLSNYNGTEGTLHIVPFSKSVYSDYSTPYSNSDYCDFLISVIDLYLSRDYTFHLANIDLLESAYRGEFNALLNNYVCITPNGKFGRRKFVDKSKEWFFQEYDSVNEWVKDMEADKTASMSRCFQCENAPNCIATEFHYHDEKDTCCGYLPLVKWWKENRHRYLRKNTYID